MKTKTPIKRLIPETYRRAAIKIYYTYKYLLLSLPSRGDRVECPFCRRNYRKLLPYGLDSTVVRDGQVVCGGRRPNAQCPRCFSLERERFLFLYLRDECALLDESKSAGRRVLHLAPESNLQKVLKSYSHLEYISADLNSPRAMMRTDITAMGFPDNAFDFIICSHVLEHIPNDIKAMTEFYRVLKPGGMAVLLTPVSPSLEKTYEDPGITGPKEREKAFGHFDHVRIYGRDFKDRLEKVGFNVVVLRYDEKTVRKYGLFPDEELYICGK